MDRTDNHIYIYGCVLSSAHHQLNTLFIIFGYRPFDNNNTEARDTVVVRHDPTGIHLTYLFQDHPRISSDSHLGSSSGAPRNIQLQTHETKPIHITCYSSQLIHIE